MAPEHLPAKKPAPARRRPAPPRPAPQPPPQKRQPLPHQRLFEALAHPLCAREVAELLRALPHPGAS